MTRRRLHPDDRVTEGDVAYRVVESNELGQVLRRVGGALNQEFTHTRFDALVKANVLRVDIGFYKEGAALARLTAGVDGFHMLRPHQQREVIMRKHYLDHFLRLRDSGFAQTTHEGIDAALAKIGPPPNGASPPKKGKRKHPSPEHTLRVPCSRTFCRWLKLYEKHDFDILGLVSGHNRTGNVEPRFPSAVEHVLRLGVARYCSLERYSKRTVHLWVQSYISEINQARAPDDQLPYPGKAALCARIAAVPAYQRDYARHGAEYVRKKYAIVALGLDVAMPLQHVQIDEWDMHLLTLVEKAGLGDIFDARDRAQLEHERIKVCAMIDIATRCIISVRFSRNANHRLGVETVAMATMDKTDIAKAFGCQTAWPMGGSLSVISPDAGGLYIHEDFRTAIANMKTLYENAPAGLSHMRGHIERVFQSMDSGLLPFLPGRTFSNVVDRGDYVSEDRAAIFSRNLPKIFIRWIVDVYHNLEHAGLGGETPFNAWKRLSAEFGAPPLVNPDQRREFFGVRLTRALNQRGVRVANVFYQSLGLQEIRRKHGDTKVEVMYDVVDIGHISVWTGNAWLKVPSTDEMFRGVSLSTWKAADADLKRRFGEQAKVARPIVHAAIRSIAATGDAAAAFYGIEPGMPTAAEIDRDERLLTIGYDLETPTMTLDGPVAKADLLAGGVAVTAIPGPPKPVPATPEPKKSKKKGGGGSPSPRPTHQLPSLLDAPHRSDVDDGDFGFESDE